MRTWVPVLVGMVALGAADDRLRFWDFEDAEIGKLPSGWRAAKTGTGAGSEWKITTDASAPRGPKVLSQTAAGPNALFNLCLAEGTRFQHLEATVRFKSNAGKLDQGGGIVWRCRDENHYYLARFNPLEENFRVYKVVAGKRMQLATCEGLKLPATQWHTLTIRMQGKHIEGILNGKKLLEADDEAFPDAGMVGLWTKADAQTSFDAFKVERLTK